MAREIDLLLEAAGKALLVVNKDSNVLLQREDLVELHGAGRFGQEDRVAPPDGRPLVVSSVYPGCPQQGSRTAGQAGYVLVGQTEHFLRFAEPGA
jgi:hypothetical protein